MALGIIEINDSGIQVAVDKQIVATSPGYAVMDGNELLLGEQALHKSRLLPRWTNNRFWNELNTNPMANSTNGIRHHADLAFAHLESLWLPNADAIDKVIFLVPAFYDQQQLGLLLGMAQECNIPVAGVADSSLMACYGSILRPTALHLDIHLHRITLTELYSGATLNRKSTETVTETGLFTLMDRWANIIANQFIQTSRFDPMHQAKSEQILFNQLPGWISQHDNSVTNTTFELDLGAARQSVSVSSDQLMKACVQIYPQILQAIRKQLPASSTASLILSHRFKGFPGLKDSLGLINNLELIEIDAQQSLTTTLESAELIIPGSGTITHTISLPITKHPRPTTNTMNVHTDDGLNNKNSIGDSSQALASHLLLGSHATAIGRSFPLSGDLTAGIQRDEVSPCCTLYPRGNCLQITVHDNTRVKINGQTTSSSSTLNPGDQLNLGEQTITLVSVE